MENATDALLIAFAILIFIIALSVSLTTLSQAKSTADIVLFTSDRENFQTFLKDDIENISEGGRIVDVKTVIATIIRCAKEKFSVKIIDGTNDEDIYIFEYDVQDQDEIEAKVNEFIKKHNGQKYRETYVEVTTSGVTYTEQADGSMLKEEDGSVVLGEDGTRLEENVGKKLYITYEIKE